MSDFKFPPLPTAEELEAAYAEEARKEEAAAQEYRALFDEHDTGSRCSACGGAVHGQASSRCTTDPMHVPIGPASRGYYVQAMSFWCDACGLKFNHPPGQKDYADRLYRLKEQMRDGF